MLETLFNDFIHYAESEHLYIEGIAVGDERKVLLEHHFTPDLARNIYSHTKSYMATAVGIALDQGKLSLEDGLADYFPEALPDEPDPRLGKITLRHLLTMSSGFNRPYLMNADRRAGVGAPDYMKYMLSRPVEVEPGSRFAYSSADSNLAGRMVEKAVGMRLGAYLYHELFSKLGQGWPLWEHDPMGHPNCGGGMFLTLTEMMKLGQLYLADGVWNGERIVASSWIREATRKQIETAPAHGGQCPGGQDPGGQEHGDQGQDVWNCGYGYQFWMSPYPDAYRADGAFGQITTVLPASGIVVAVQCPEYGDFEKVKLALHERLLSQL